jgi:glycosyltransferase involved in cell wall biosynthesis
MKITYITEYFPYSNEEDISGGVEARCINLSKEISKKHDITIITSWKKDQKREHNIDNIKILRVGPHHKYSNLGNIVSRLKFSLAAYKTAKKIKADIVEGFSFISYLPAYYSAKKINAKKIATYHEVWLGEWIKHKGFLTGVLGEIWERWILSLNWDKIISVSNFTKEKLIKSKIKNSKIKVIHNGINIEKYQIKETKYDLPTICSISRLTPQKRIKDIILALKIVKKEISNIQLKIIGQGKELENLKKLTNKLNLEKNIIFEGFVKHHKDVIKILKKSHIFCLPSILEGFGIVIVEAIASKTPYICSDIEVLKEITNDGKGGLIFKKKNYEDLAKKIIILLKNKKLYLTKIEEESKEVQKYEWKKISEEVNNIYHESFIHI